MSSTTPMTELTSLCERLREIQAEMKRCVDHVAKDYGAADPWGIEDHICAHHILISNANWAIYQTLDALASGGNSRPQSEGQGD